MNDKPFLELVSTLSPYAAATLIHMLELGWDEYKNMKDEHVAEKILVKNSIVSDSVRIRILSGVVKVYRHQSNMVQIGHDHKQTVLEAVMDYLTALTVDISRNGDKEKIVIEGRSVIRTV